MKKNIMMRIASVLMIAVLLTTCVISGTFAKYTAQATGTATANVAKWAFEIQDEDIFADDFQSFSFNLFETAAIDTKDSNTEGDVTVGKIAPGTKGQFEIELANTSDVTVNYSISFSASTTLPIVYRLSGESEWNSTIAGVNSNDTIAIGNSDAIIVEWMWAYDTTEHPESSDQDDNAAGIAAGVFTITATINVTQVN